MTGAPYHNDDCTRLDEPKQETDLETALKAQIAEWREFASGDVEYHDYNEGVNAGVNACANDLETLLENHTDAATELAKKTGRPKEAFEADEYEMPELDELEPVEPAAYEMEVKGPANSEWKTHIWPAEDCPENPAEAWRDDHNVQNVRPLVYASEPMDPEVKQLVAQMEDAT